MPLPTPNNELEEIEKEKNKLTPGIPVYTEEEAKEILDYNGFYKSEAQYRQEDIKRGMKNMNNYIQNMIKSGKKITQKDLDDMYKNLSLAGKLPI